MNRRLMFLGGVSVLALGGCAAGVASRDAAARRKTPPVGKFVSVGNTKVHYVKRGQGPNVILIHGAGSNLREWTFRLMDQLTENYTVLAFDRPGHGYTDTLHKRGESPAEQAALLQAAAAKLGVEQAIVAGHSFGGAVVLAWTLNHPESVTGTVVISGVSNPWEGDVDSFYKINASPLTGGLVTSSIAALASEQRVIKGFKGAFRPQSLPKGYVDHMGIDLAVRSSQLRANGRQVANMKPHITAMSKRYGEIKTPVEIIHGTEDQSVGAHIHADVLITQISQANYQKMEGMGHGTQQLAHPQILTAINRIARG